MDTREKEMETTVEKPVPKKVVEKSKPFDAKNEIVQLKAAIRFLAMQLGSAQQHESFKTLFPDLFK